MMRSVTAAIRESRAMRAPLLVPADAVALRQRDRCRRAPRPRGIRSRGDALFGPGRADAVDPAPLRFDLVAADEQSRVALDQVEQQPLISNAAPVLAECVGKAEVERDLAE